MARRHGPSGYTGRCRCDTCTTGKRTVLRDRYRRIAYGQPTTDLTDAGPVRDHLRTLMRTGASLAQITDEAGVSYGVLSRILYQGQKRVKANSAAAILALHDIDTSASRALIDPSGTRRRIQALASVGWPVSWQARQCGSHPPDFHQITWGRGHVAASTAAKVRTLYEQWWNTTPPEGQPASLTRRRAREKRWIPPGGWDEELLDMPETELAAEIDRQVQAMDETELGRCYRAVLDGERSPVMAAAAPRYLAAVRERRARQTTAA